MRMTIVIPALICGSIAAMDKQLADDLSCAARILGREGLSVLIAGHLSVAVDEQMYVNRFGPSFERVRPEDILVVDFSGRIIEGDGFVNDTILLHGVLHRLLPGARALVHTHPRSVVTLSAFRTVPDIYDQESCFLAGDVAVYEDEYQGLVTSEERIAPMAKALAKARNLLLPNHGALTSGDNIRAATIRMVLLENIAKRYIEVQQAAAFLGSTPRPIPMETALRTRRELEGLAAENLVWQDWIAKL
jgi:ribulose-5-phosphate 4-epimerase/fuculose-1-phosphate aldolase